jgi:hypothetical protein
MQPTRTFTNLKFDREEMDKSKGEDGNGNNNSTKMAQGD